MGSTVGLVRDLFRSLSGVINGIVQGIFGSIYELGKGILELLDGLVF